MSKKALVLPFAATAMGLVLAACGGFSRPGLARGRELFDTCVPCHGSDGAGSLALGAPQIAGLPKWYLIAQLNKFKGSIRGAHPDDMEGHRMRPMARSLHVPGDVESVAEFVSKLPPHTVGSQLQGGDAEAGRNRYSMVCIACHGPDGKGNEALRAPALAGQADWYLYAQLGKFKSGMRGTHPQDTTGAQMRAMSLTMEDDRAMRDVVAYIRTLK